jgi:hypothetical protein
VGRRNGITTAAIRFEKFELIALAENGKIGTHCGKLLRVIEGHLVHPNKVNAEAVLSAALGGSELDEGRDALRQWGNHSVEPGVAKGRREAVNLGVSDLVGMPPRSAWIISKARVPLIS